MTVTHSLPTTVGFGQIARGFSGMGAAGMADAGQRYETIETSYNPDEQVAQTMPLIQRFASEDSQHPMVKRLAYSYAANMPGASTAQVAWQAAKDHLVFKDDQSIAASSVPGMTEFIVEVLRRPVDVLLYNGYEGRKAEGDCDDHSMFSAAVGAALGAEVQFVTVAANPDEPGTLSHIYTVIDGIPCDASHGPMAGWEVPASHVSRREVYGLSSSAPLWILATAIAWYVFGPYLKTRFGL